MPSPFPGMDPYLEHPDLWPEVHNRLIVAIADFLGPQLRPKYRAAIEQRVYRDADAALLIGRPDVSVIQHSAPDAQPSSSSRSSVITDPVEVELPMPEEIRERYLNILKVGTGDVVTTLEVISPSNKRLGKGRNLYEQKRAEILESQTHLVEIDLIRAFAPLPVRGNIGDSLYRILVSRAQRRPRADLYPFNLDTPVPSFPLPLLPDDEELSVNLQALLNQVYDRAGYDLVIDYTSDPLPPLDDAARAWIDALLKETGVRSP